MAVEASIVVSFAEGVDSDVVVVEFDPEHSNNLDSDGNLKGTFDVGPPPDNPVILLHYGASLAVGDIVVTDGSISNPAIGTNISQERTSEVTFASPGDTAGITYANITGVSLAWVGSVLSGTVEVDGTSLKLLTGGPCTGVATFDVVFQKQYMLTPPNPIPLDDDGDYQITIFINMIGA